ncbi:unnamed protein product [Gulo gulo]|uniref:Uncharacterized protein n=1 Tax=Gulo gulo TaxID=48420 RepID=A0A9X9QAV0_GULGU|nr:unnamed protein product [Gulo gulo]
MEGAVLGRGLGGLKRKKKNKAKQNP